MDARVQNTKAHLRTGLLSLMKSAPLNDLTTQDIIEAANVSRKTFYTYYKDKQALLDDLEQRILTGLQEALATDRAVLTTLDHTPNAEEIVELAQRSFKHTVRLISQHRQAGQVLLADHGDLNLMIKIQQLAIQEFRHRAPLIFNLTRPATTDPDSSFPVDYLVVLYVGAVTSVLIHWVRAKHPLPEKRVLAILGAVQVTSPLQLVEQVDIASARHVIEHPCFPEN